MRAEIAAPPVPDLEPSIDVCGKVNQADTDGCVSPEGPWPARVPAITEEWADKQEKHKKGAKQIGLEIRHEW